MGGDAQNVTNLSPNEIKLILLDCRLVHNPDMGRYTIFNCRIGKWLRYRGVLIGGGVPDKMHFISAADAIKGAVEAGDDEQRWY